MKSEALKKIKKDFRWDIYQCSLKCFNCQYVNPHVLVNQDHYINCPSGKKFAFDSYFAGGKMEIARGILDGSLKLPTNKILEIFYTCTTCGSCQEMCYYNREMRPLEVFEAVREYLVEQEIGPLPEHISFINSIKNKHNPYKEEHEKRLDWLENKDILKDSKLLYFVGCTSSYRTQNIAKATTKIMEQLNIDFNIAGNEWCCGSPLFRVGAVKLGEEVMRHNIEEINKMKVEKIIFSCAGCYRTFKKDYPAHGIEFDFEIQHISEFLSDLIKSNKIKFKNLDLSVTYHDPCHLGRHAGVYQAPRDVISSIPNIKLIEMYRNRYNTWCCGAGGGVKSGYKDFALETANERIEEVKKTGTKTLVSTCPFCNLNFKDCVKANKENIEILDLTELLLKGGISC
ncbi:MAG: (Fe-S)-binding protein [Candidatus Hodarchaeota archaeon]